MHLKENRSQKKKAVCVASTETAAIFRVLANYALWNGRREDWWKKKGVRELNCDNTQTTMFETKKKAEKKERKTQAIRKEEPFDLRGKSCKAKWMSFFSFIMIVVFYWIGHTVSRFALRFLAFQRMRGNGGSAEVPFLKSLVIMMTRRGCCL